MFAGANECSPIKTNSAYNSVNEKIKPKQLLEVIKDPKSYLFALMQGSCVLGVGVVGSFLPTFISSFGFSTGKSSLSSFSLSLYTSTSMDWA